jgi:GT2 family glycosyltransferase
MFKENPPLVSVIGLNWNNTPLTCDLLQSIKDKCRYPNLELIIVDNGSDDDPSAACRAICPEVIMILTGQNLGFAGGNNAGIKAAKGEYIFIVNNDTEFTPLILEGLLDIFEKYPDAGIVSPKFHYFFHKGTIEYAGYQSVNIFSGRNAMIGCQQEDKGQFNTIQVTHYAHGGAMMVSRKVIREVGLLPELFFLYYEEFDWCEQIKRKGYKVYYQPASLIYHKESMTTGKASPLKTYYLTRNRILFMRRNSRLPNFLIFIIYFVCFTIPKNTGIFLFRGQKKHLKSFWKGILWHLNKNITFN